MDLGLGLDLSGNSVQVSPSLAGQPPPTVGILLHQLESLQGLQGLPGHTSGSLAPVRGSTAVALTDAVDFADGGDTNWGPEGRYRLRYPERRARGLT